MDIEYKGGNCILISHKKADIVVDPGIGQFGLKDQGAKAKVQLLTQPNFAAPGGEGVVVIDGPGDYEVADVSIKGVAAQAHLDPKDKPYAATMYRLDVPGIAMAVVGHVNPDINEEQLESLGVVDIVVVPVGGNGYTLDPTGAIKLIRAIDPKVVIPTNFADSAIKYPVPQGEVGDFIKELGAPVQVVNKLKIKNGVAEESLTVYHITRTS